ncbi:class I SAM-dependent methyltransferase [Cytobacillus sp. FJAT-54145]|uniref:Class I SAM-dependent methyltransferase n=1 Tax=Cytobacillus spartinae TaxID=3299023 RepID=A0ABW6KET4_9BACI
MKEVNFGLVAKSYAKSRNDIPSNLFESFTIRNIFFEGKRVVDIACGTGALTRKLDLRNADVIGVDPSIELIKEAQNINALEYKNIRYEVGSAEKTNLPSNDFDIVTVMRAWHWFNREESIKEIKRLLKNKGILIVADSGFVPPHEVTDFTFDVLKRHIPDGVKPPGSKAESKQRINGFPVEWFDEWSKNEFDLRDFYKLDYKVQFSNSEWLDRVTSLSYLAGLEEEPRKNIIEELLNLLDTKFGKDAMHTIPHACYVSILKLHK